MASLCEECGNMIYVGSWPFCPHEPTKTRPITIHPKERAVVYQHPVTGEVAYPGRNDVSMPKTYRDAGYVRRELPTLRDVHKFEAESGKLSEAAWFDPGTGRGFDDQDAPGLPDNVQQMIRDGQITIKMRSH